MAMLNNQRVLCVLPGPQDSPSIWALGSDRMARVSGLRSIVGMRITTWAGVVGTHRKPDPKHQVTKCKTNRPGNMFVSGKTAPWHPDPLSILGKQPAVTGKILESDVVENTTTTSWICWFPEFAHHHIKPPTWCPSWLYHCAKRESQSQALNCWSLRLEGSIIREL